MSPEAAPSPPETFRELLTQTAARFRLPLGEDALSALSVFLSELDRWRRAMDLTGPLTREELCVHTLESAYGASLLPQGAAVLDIGSGAGFPGVPVAIVRPDISLSAVEPRAKRAEFLRHAARAVPIRNLRVIHARVRDVSGQSWGAATVRALGRLGDLLGEAPFLESGAALLVWTTEPEVLAKQLSPRFALERIEPIPGARRRAVAVYRKAGPPPSRQISEEEGVFPVERSR